MTQAPILLILASHFSQSEMQHSIDPTQHNIYVAVAGSSLGGRQFERILITREARLEMNNPDLSDPLFVQNAQQWLRDSAMCRLGRDGVVVNI